MKPLIRLPDVVSDAWDHRQPLAILSTVSATGVPNAIYVSIMDRYDDTTFFVANNFFHKTRQNILDHGQASLLFVTFTMQSFQLKGEIELHDTGPIFQAMKRINPAQCPGHAAAVLRVKQVFQGANQLI